MDKILLFVEAVSDLVPGTVQSVCASKWELRKKVPVSVDPALKGLRLDTRPILLAVSLG